MTRHLPYGAVLLLLCAIGLRVDARPPASAGAGWATSSSFAIADLDGDQQPDLASIEMGIPNGIATKYWIRVQLSAWPESAIGVEAPLGGLRIFAADVNGDDQIDLIVRTAQRSSLIAVLVNDGEGHFQVENPGNYPELEHESESFLRNGQAGSFWESIALLTRTMSLEPGAAENQFTARVFARKTSLEQIEFVPQKSNSPHAGRAPPSVFELI